MGQAQPLVKAVLQFVSRVGLIGAGVRCLASAALLVSASAMICFQGLVIDFTAPEGTRVLVDDNGVLREVGEAVRRVEAETAISLWPILTEFVVMLAGGIVLGKVARYVVEAGLMRTVDEIEETGRRPGLVAAPPTV